MEKNEAKKIFFETLKANSIKRRAEIERNSRAQGKTAEE